MVSAYVDGIGVWAPGLYGWDHASSRLLHTTLDGDDTSPPLPQSTLLPPAERRRAVPLVRLALVALEEALEQAGLAPRETATVFASSGSDGTTLNELLSTLATRPEDVSPTRFHNAVHNAAAGYWSIAVKCQAPSTSVAGYDDSFAVGLLEAMATVADGAAPVALCAYEMPYPEPLAAARPIRASVSIALVLTPFSGPRSVARIDADLGPRQSASAAPAAFEPLREGNPAARALPCLYACARRTRATLAFDYPGERSLILSVEPC